MCTPAAGNTAAAAAARLGECPFIDTKIPSCVALPFYGAFYSLALSPVSRVLYV